MNRQLVLNYFTTYLFLSIFLQSFAFATECPPGELIHPCTCKKLSNSLIVDCIGINYLEDFRKIFDKVNGWKFDKLNIEECSMLYIPSSIFKKAEFNLLHIERSTLTSIFDETPDSVKSIKEIRIDTTRIQHGIDWKHLKNFELETLSVYDTVIRELGKDFKESIGSSNVRLLTFVLNGIRRLTNQPFENLHNLHELNLDNQKFKSLEPMTFPENLNFITLRANNFTTLPDHFFGARPKLEVWVEDNRFSEMPQAVFGGIKSVYIRGNPLECTCGMKWLTDDRYKLYGVDGICVSPSNVKGKEIDHLQASDFNYCA